MAPGKKTLTLKSKFTEDASLAPDLSKVNKTGKRPLKNSPDEEDDDMIKSKPIGQYQKSIKKLKVFPEEEVADTLIKLQDFFGQQDHARKQYIGNIFKNVSEIKSELEADYKIMKVNEQKLEQFAGSIVKNVEQATVACKQKLKQLDEIQSSYIKQVEGLLARGAMKPDDRPIWFDVYRAFPPLVEPKFARPKPDVNPIRQTFYKEDVIRAEFHSKGHGLGAVPIPKLKDLSNNMKYYRLKDCQKMSLLRSQYQQSASKGKSNTKRPPRQKLKPRKHLTLLPPKC